MMEEKRQEKHYQDINSSSHQESSQGTSLNSSALKAAEPASVATQSFSSLLPKALSSVLHSALPPSQNSASQNCRNPNGHSPNLERLQTELRDLRDQFEQMKSQHNKEIKLLMNELDEEKRIRLTLQMEIQRIKKHMSK
ncbi:SH3 domain-containing kinase-binding protein 1 [Oryzias latipes]|uniref:SH3 domain-containing kinase-binding protein 1 n=1 Tax=Oryzias latipes TaxID=8090 RepID=UPI0009DB310A|nr:SH3 domain-containing kinase-binding protein 1 [Oryzias latipes]XP_020564550.1 SH3 domain-containing kinase-binding protein 1 [Oryzias latipes]